MRNRQLQRALIQSVSRIKASSHMARTSTSSDEQLREFCREILKQEAILRQGGGKAGLERQRKLGRLPARGRIGHLPEKDEQSFGIGAWAAHRIFQAWG